MQATKPFASEARHFEARNENRPEGPQGPPWPPDRKVHPPGSQSVTSGRGQAFAVAYSQTPPGPPMNPPGPASQVSPSHPQTMSPPQPPTSRYHFTRRDLDRCLYGKQEIAVVQIDAPKKEENALEDKGKPAKWCDICQEIRFGECPTHGPLPSMLPTMTLSGPKTYAISTFPEEVGLCRSSILFAEYGVFARHFIPLGTWIGPYEGKKVSADDGMRMMTRDTPFMWEIYENGRLSHFLNAGDENYSSWMRFIQCARHKGEQNLYVFQYYGSIYYRAFKDIPVGMELLVWYDEKYPQYLGVPLEIKDMSSCTVESIQTPTEVANRFTDEQAGSQSRIQSQSKVSRTVMELGKHPLVVSSIPSMQQVERPRPQLPSLPPPLSQAPGMGVPARFHSPGGPQPPFDYQLKSFLVAGPPERFTSEQGKKMLQQHTLTYGKEPHPVFPRPGHPGEELAKALVSPGHTEKTPAFSVDHDKISLASSSFIRPQMPVSVYQYPSQVGPKGGSSSHPYERPMPNDPGIRYPQPDPHGNRNMMMGHGPYVTSTDHGARVSSKEFSHGVPVNIKPRPQVSGVAVLNHVPFVNVSHGVFPGHQMAASLPNSIELTSPRMVEVTVKPTMGDKRSPIVSEIPGQFRPERLPSGSYELGNPSSPQMSARPGPQSGGQPSSLTPPTLIHVDRCSTIGPIRDENQNEILRNQDPALNGMKVEWKCFRCLQRYGDQAALNSHTCSLEKDKLYQCARCSSTFQTAQQLDNHILLTHTQDRVFRCGLCSISFSGAADLDAHMRMHNNVRALEHTDGRKPLESS